MTTSDSIRGVRVKDLTYHVDQRGHLMEIFRADDPTFTQFGQTYITTCNPGIVKAWHRHSLQDDNMCVIHGMGLIGLWDEETDETMSIFAGELTPRLVHIPAGIWHGFTPANNHSITVLNVTTHPYNYDSPDEHRLSVDYELIPFDWNARSG
jgi:dTDP-4-dehydrorhamnose 3,5-epimerase